MITTAENQFKKIVNKAGRIYQNGVMNIYTWISGGGEIKSDRDWTGLKLQMFCDT